MFKYRFVFIIILYFFVATTQISGDEADIITDNNNTEAVLRRIKNASADIVTLSGDFVQKKKIEIVKDMPDSKGKFYYKNPDNLRWEILEPVTMGFIVNGNSGKKWRGKSGRSRKFNIEKEPTIGVISNQVFAWAKGDFEKLKAGYEIILLNEDPIEIKLIPLSSIEKKYIESIILAFSETDNYVNRLEINEKKGGCTQIIFHDMVINAQLQEDIF